MKKFNFLSNKIIIESGNSKLKRKITHTDPVQNKKKIKTNIYESNTVPENSNFYGESTSNLENLNFTLSSKVFFLSGERDNVQVSVVLQNNVDYNLTVIKKVMFKDGYHFISGCSCNSGDDFLVLDESSVVFDFKDATPLEKCSHLKECLSMILRKFLISKNNVSETELQEILTKYCTHSNSNSHFFNHDNTLLATISHSDGLLLFIKKNNRYKCVLCNKNNSFKCRHFKNLLRDIPENQMLLEDNPELYMPMEVKTNPSSTLPLLSKQKFLGKKN